MTRRRWIADEVSGERAALLGKHADHLVRVLRARVGEQFDIAIGTSVRRGTIIAIAPERVEFQLNEELPVTAGPHVTLALSIFKFDRMEWAIEKCTELGAAEIVPVIANRTDAHLAAAAIKRVERWRRIVREAAEQSRRASVPEIREPVRWEDMLDMPGAARILLAESSAQKSLKEALEISGDGAMTLAVGPEGGWTEEELEAFINAGWMAASLGTTILRAETAAIAGLALVMALCPKPQH